MPGYTRPMYYPDWIPDQGAVTRGQYRRYPYARATLPDGTTRNGKVTAWTTERAYFRWTDTDGSNVQQLWMDTEHVTRIKRADADVQDPYDDVEWYLERGW